MSFKKYKKNINLLLITHGFGQQTQFIESLLDGHSQIIQFPTNYKDYFLNLKSKNFVDAIDEFIYGNPGYVYDIFDVGKNKVRILNRSRIVPLIHDRDTFYFDKESLAEINNIKKLKKYSKFIKKNLLVVFQKKFLFKDAISKKFKFNNNELNNLLLNAKSIYKLNPHKFKKIFLNTIQREKLNIEFNKKNLLLLLHYCLAIYLKKNTNSLKYILFNLHDYTNTKEILEDFRNSYHFSFAQDLKSHFSRQKFKRSGDKNLSLLNFAYTEIKCVNELLKLFRFKVNRNYLFHNHYIKKQKGKFVDLMLRLLKLNKEKICYYSTYLGRRTFGNSGNQKVLKSFSNDFDFFDWWNYLKSYEIYYLDFFFKGFFKIFKNSPSKKKINFVFPLYYLNIYRYFFIEDFCHFFKSEMVSNKYYKLTNLNKFSYYRFFRYPSRILIYGLTYPLVFSLKIFKILYFNSIFRNSKIKFREFF